MILLVLGSLVLGGLLFALWWTWGPGVGWRYMAPYRNLVAKHATEAQVISEVGKPSAVAKTKAEFDGWLYNFSTADTARLWSGGLFLWTMRILGMTERALSFTWRSTARAERRGRSWLDARSTSCRAAETVGRADC